MSVGIVGYGCYVPRYRIKTEEIARIWGQNAENIKKSLIISEKAVAGMDEDTITMSVEAAKNALMCTGPGQKSVGALFVGSESHPYTVKPSGTVVAEALGITPEIMVADMEFACKAATAAIQICSAFVRAGDIENGLAIGADTAQGRPGDALEFTAASGAAAFLIGKAPLAEIEGTYSYTTDTPDFWRRGGQDYPQHGGRFTGEPGYFHHLMSATNGLLSKLSLKASDFDHVVFHMPNGKFPLAAAKKLGIGKEKLAAGLVVDKIGNTYSASSLLGLCATLDVAQPGERILLTSFGSGAGADSFSLKVTDKIKERRPPKSFEYYLSRKEYIDYGTYVKIRKKLNM